MSAAAIQKLYETEYSGFDDYLYLLNGFREHADRLMYIMKMVHSLEAASLLDVGCNRGLFGALCNWNHRPFMRMVGVDIVPGLLQRAKETHGYDSAILLNVSDPFYLSETFDLVLCMEVLEHVPDPGTVIENCFRHATKNIIFTTPEEEGDIDGVIHVRKINLDALAEMVCRPGWKLHQSFIPSIFCEKPHWQGWNCVRAERV